MPDRSLVAPGTVPSNSNASLPANRNAALPALQQQQQCQRAERTLAPLHELAPRLGSLDTEADLAQARQVLATVERSRGALTVITEPASGDEIVIAVGCLYACFPQRQGKEKRIFMHFLCEHVGEARPSLLALEAACRHLRLTYKFPGGPSIAEFMEALKGAKPQTLNLRSLIDKIPSMHRRLDANAQDLPRLKLERARQVAMAKGELRRAAMEEGWDYDEGADEEQGEERDDNE
jgi:hypothetical protein